MVCIEKYDKFHLDFCLKASELSPVFYALILRARNLPFPEGFLRASVYWALTEKRIRPRKKSVTCCRPSDPHSQKGSQPIKDEVNRNGKVAFPYSPNEDFCAIPGKLCVCNPRASMCHGTGGCLCPRTIHAELNQGETSPQHRQLFCGNNKTKGSAGTGCPLNWRSGGCCFQQSTCVLISASFACVCLSFLISSGPGPDYIHTAQLIPTLAHLADLTNHLPTPSIQPRDTGHLSGTSESAGRESSRSGSPRR